MSHVDEILSLHDSFKLFEPNADMAMKMLHANSDKNEIFKKTGHVVGVFDASFFSQARRDLRHHGPIWLGQVDHGAAIQPPDRARLRQHPSQRPEDPWTLLAIFLDRLTQAMGARTNADPSQRWYHSGPIGLPMRLFKPKGVGERRTA